MNNYKPIPLKVGTFYKLTKLKSVYPPGTILRYDGYSISKFFDNTVYHLFTPVITDGINDTLRFSRYVVSDSMQEIKDIKKQKEA